MKTSDASTFDVGQSVWLDYSSRTDPFWRSRADDGNGLRGMTSNPTVFEHAIAESNDYDQALRASPNRRISGPRGFKHAGDPGHSGSRGHSSPCI